MQWQHGFGADCLRYRDCHAGAEPDAGKPLKGDGPLGTIAGLRNRILRILG